MRLLRRLLGVAVIVGLMVLGVRFVLLNPQPITIVFPFVAVEEVALWLALAIAFAAGVAVAGLLALYQIARLGLLARRYRKAASGLESEVHQLRNLPLASETGRPPRGSAGSAPELGAPVRTAGRGV